jgi:hypothetical protein
MKKDAVYTMRMNSRVREALRKAATKERRTVASLLDKIVTDYLAKEGFLTGPELGTERRRFLRKKITLPARTFLKTELRDEAFPGVVLEISMGGLLVTYPKGSEIRFTSTGELPRFEIRFAIPREDEELRFDCETRHMRDTGDEIQVGATFTDPEGNSLQKLNSYLM